MLQTTEITYKSPEFVPERQLRSLPSTQEREALEKKLRIDNPERYSNDGSMTDDGSYEPVLFNDMDPCILRRHLKRRKDRNKEILEKRYKGLSNEVRDSILNLSHEPENLFEGAPSLLESRISAYEGVYEGQKDELLRAKYEVSSNKGIGKVIKSNETFAIALEILKDYDTVYEALRGYSDMMSPIEEKNHLRDVSAIEQDSPLSKPEYRYSKRKLNDFLEEKGLSRNGYRQLRAAIKREFGEELDHLRRHVKGWSVRDMGDPQKKSVYDAWMNWNRDGKTKKSFVENHNISSMYTLNKVISEYTG